MAHHTCTRHEGSQTCLPSAIAAACGLGLRLVRSLGIPAAAIAAAAALALLAGGPAPWSAVTAMLAQAAKERAGADSWSEALAFAIDRDQAPGGVARFVARGADVAVDLEPAKARLRLSRHGRDVADLVLRWPGARGKVTMTGEEKLPGAADRWRRVRYRQLYPGIDVIFYANPQRFEYDFALAPGADLSPVRLAFDGVSRLQIEAPTADLLLYAGETMVRQHRPVVFRQVGEARLEIDARYEVDHDGLVRLVLPP